MGSEMCIRDSVSEAPSFGKPVLLYDLDCQGSQAYIALAVEVIKQERN